MQTTDQAGREKPLLKTAADLEDDAEAAQSRRPGLEHGRRLPGFLAHSGAHRLQGALDVHHVHLPQAADHLGRLLLQERLCRRFVARHLLGHSQVVQAVHGAPGGKGSSMKLPGAQEQIALFSSSHCLQCHIA